MLINKQFIITLICGVLSGAIFSVAAYSESSGLLVMFLPVLPLALLGLSSSAQNTMLASIVACIVIGVLLDADFMPLFIILTAFPAFHCIRKALLWRGDDNARKWYPSLSIFAELAAMTAVLFMLFAISASHSEHAELKSIIAKSLTGQLDNPDPAVTRFMQIIITQWSFLIFAGVSWIWVLLLYFFIASANAILRNYHIALRPSLAVSEEGAPLWLPVIVLICGVLALVGHGNDQFAAETVLLILLLPYFLSGIAGFHRISLGWKNRALWLTMFYIGLTFFFPWIAVLLIARGLQIQIEPILKGKMG